MNTAFRCRATDSPSKRPVMTVDAWKTLCNYRLEYRN
jgi:hypothetical protein